jgi:hypothetical protein
MPILHLMRLSVRAAVFLAALAVPVLAMPAMQSSPTRVIEAPAMQKKGLGLVILVALQRN